MRISKFNNFLLNEEIEAKGVYYIFEKPFRIDDLMKSNLFELRDISTWAKKHEFDKWAVGLFVSDEQIDIESPIERYGSDKSKTHEYSEEELLDVEKEEAEEKFFDLKELLEKTPDKTKLRISSRGTKNKIKFDTKSQGMSGIIVDECRIQYEDVNLKLFIFNKGKNDKARARQLHGFVYEEEVRKRFDLEKPTKGEKWDAVGRINFDFIAEKMVDYDVYIVDGGIKRKINYIRDIESEFDKSSVLNWSIKASSNKAGTSLYFGDFKRISGLEYKNDRLILNKTELNKYILVVGKHERGEFVKEYLIEIDINKWMKYLPDNLGSKEVLEKLENMYSELKKHKAKGKEEQKRGDKAWKEYVEVYSKLTEGEYKISLNFKRDSKEQIRIQSSMNSKLFEKLLSENKHILLEKK
jgi:hypothetical protein